MTKKSSENITRSCSAWRDSVDGRCFMTVSSVSISVALEQNREAHIATHQVPSWSLEQYQLACEDSKFFVQVKNKLKCNNNDDTEKLYELVLSKYYFAGGSARWMFEFDVKDFIE